MRRIGRGIFILFLLAAAGLAGLSVWAGLAWHWSALAGLNAATLLCFGYDKHQAIMKGRRVPERVLHTLTLLGGTVGAGLGMGIFRHKIHDKGFRLVFFFIVLVQAAAVYLVWRFWR